MNSALTANVPQNLGNSEHVGENNGNGSINNGTNNHHKLQNFPAIGFKIVESINSEKQKHAGKHNEHDTNFN